MFNGGKYKKGKKKLFQVIYHAVNEPMILTKLVKAQSITGLVPNDRNKRNGLGNGPEQPMWRESSQ